MKNRNAGPTDELLPEYDFASMKGGVRGKHVERLREGTNIVLVDPDVAAAFPSADAVNEALRGILNTARAVRQTGGLPNTTLRLKTRPRRKNAPRQSGRLARG
jgi:hypothetical protein